MKLSIKIIFIKCDQIHSFLRIWSHLLKKSLMENFIFCAVRGILNENHYPVNIYLLKVINRNTRKSEKIFWLPRVDIRFLFSWHWTLNRRLKVAEVIANHTVHRSLINGSIIIDIIKSLESDSQLTFTCSKSTIGTLEKGVKYVQN